MGAPRKITIDYLNSLLSSSNYKVISRCDNPNYCKILFKDCLHNKNVSIASVGIKESYCEICFENNLSKLLSIKGYELLTKLKYGVNKSSYEYRLCRCKRCGNFITTLPSMIYSTSEIFCGICNYNYYKELAKNKGYYLINRLDKFSLKLKCPCGTEFSYQTSNIKRSTPKCPSCGRKDNGSYVYLFQIDNAFGQFIKIGKSNNPYLRHLRFSENSLNDYYFIGAKKFSTEPEALLFEKYLLSKYSNFSISTSFAKTFIDNGFTEVFSYDIFDLIKKELLN